MSDSEGDFSDELLELAGATEKRRRKKQAQSKPSKRRKADVSDSDSDQDAQGSEADDSNPYPLEGKYINEADRNRLLELPEIEREDILAQRLEELQRIQDKRNLDQMLRDRSGTGGDPVSGAVKRQHKQRGETKEKRSKLDELKAKRTAKAEKKRTRPDTSPTRRSSSPTDMELSSGSSSEDEDGQISKLEEQQDKEARLYGSKPNPEDEPTTLADLEKIRLGRDAIAKHCMAPWFEDYVKGAWVRYLIGSDGGEPVYRICEVANLAQDLVKPYKINDQTINSAFELRYGRSEKVFNMDKVSNSGFNQKEWDRLTRTCEHEKVKLPTKRQIERKAAQLKKLATQPMTESDINAMLARKAALQQKTSSTSLTMEKSRLMQARLLAFRRNDTAEIAQIDAKLAELASSTPSKSDQTRNKAGDGSNGDVLAKVNERNRRANLEAIRKAELAEIERKRRERDRVAALRSESRAGTATPRSESPLPSTTNTTSSRPPDSKTNFETSVLEEVEIDLGDF